VEKTSKNPDKNLYFVAVNYIKYNLINW